MTARAPSSFLIDRESLRRRHRYLSAPAPIYFPSEQEMPETNRHMEQRTALYWILKLELAHTSTLGSDQFVYYDPTTASKCLAPDVFVWLGAPHQTFDTWKTWERGAPHLAVEIASKSDHDEEDWDDKLERYRASGIGEIVRFDARDKRRSIRIWDRLDEVLVERAGDDPDLLHCEALDLWWVVVNDAETGPMVRLARDRAGKELLPTPNEVAKREAEAAKLAAEAAKREAEAAKLAAEAARREAEAAKVAVEARSRAEAAEREARSQAEAAEQKNAELAAEVAALRALLHQNQRDKT